MPAGTQSGKPGQADTSEGTTTGTRSCCSAVLRYIARVIAKREHVDAHTMRYRRGLSVVDADSPAAGGGGRRHQGGRAAGVDDLADRAEQ
jgi:hypothetical protein